MRTIVALPQVRQRWPAGGRHEVVELEAATVAHDVDVLSVGQRAAAGGDRRLQDRVNGVAKPANVGGLQRVGQPVGAETSSMKDLVAVDVADSGDHVLIEEQRLQLTRSVTEDEAELSNRQSIGDRIDAHLGQLGDLDSRTRIRSNTTISPKVPRIDEPQLPRVDHRRGVARRGCGSATGAPSTLTSTRPLMRRWIINESPVSSEHTMYLPRRPIEVMVAPVSPSISAWQAEHARQPLAANFYPVDPTPDHERQHPAAHRLDLGKLGHD